MSTEQLSLSLTLSEVELLLAALAHYEQKLQYERPENLAYNIRVLRDKLTAED